MKRVLLALALLPLTGCIWDPTNRTNQESTATITVSGYAATAGATVTLAAKNQDTGVVQNIGSATAAMSPTYTNPYNMYYWSTTITPGASYWSPQSVTVNGQGLPLNGLPWSAGRLEFTATSNGGSPFATFSASAKNCVGTHLLNGDTPFAAGSACTDGSSITVFDNNGVGNGAPSGGWQWVENGPNPPAGVAWEMGYYTVQGLQIYGIICRPTSPGTHRAVIYNHGGFALDQGSINTFCLGPAQQGWVAALSGYRGELIAKPSGGTQLSWGGIELCQGEVTDVLRLTEIVRARSDVDPNRILMWGHSHGACITERAVQRGAQVKAAASFAAPNDFADWYNYCPVGSACDNAYPGNAANIASTLGIPLFQISVTPNQSLIPYDWRSPAKYKEDLAARSDVKLLMLQGASDLLIQPRQACTLAQGTNSLNWHINAAGAPVGSPQPGTSCDSLSWQSTALPMNTWPAQRYLLVFDNYTHETVLSGAPFNAFTNWANLIVP